MNRESTLPTAAAPKPIPNAEITQLAQRFLALYDGARRCHGFTRITGEWRADGKALVKSFCKKEPVNVALWIKHLCGNYSFGVYPLRDAEGSHEFCQWGAIDVDKYVDFDLAEVAQRVATAGFPLVTVRSKSGGCHATLFATEPVLAARMRAALYSMAKELNLSVNEIFPKQDSTPADTTVFHPGSMLNMPYFNGVEGGRYGVRLDGSAMAAEEFLEFAEDRRMGPEYFAVTTALGDLAHANTTQDGSWGPNEELPPDVARFFGEHEGEGITGWMQPMVSYPVQETREMLQYVDAGPGSYNTWVRVLFALLDTYGTGFPTFEIWEEYSKKHPAYNPKEVREKFDHIRRKAAGRALQKPCTFGTIVALARAGGWVPRDKSAEEIAFDRQVRVDLVAEFDRKKAA